MHCICKLENSFCETVETCRGDGFAKALSTLATIVAEFGDIGRFRRHWPFSATVAVFGDSRRFRQQSPNSATIVASVDRT